jgi:hypothetical protein
MKFFTGFKLTILMAVLFTFFVTSYTQAEEYKWLKTSKIDNIFVYTDFNNCDFITDKLNETLKRTLLRYNIKATISDSLAFQTTVKRGKLIREELDPELTSDNKIILHIYGKCIEYKSAHIYQFDIHFGVLNRKYTQALLYSSPQHNVMGLDTMIGIDRAFRKLMEDAVEDYVSANKAK